MGRLLSETGVWRTRTQQIFDPIKKELTRRQYIVWDPEPSRDLDFVWVPDSFSDDTEGLVSGRGTLIWRLKGKPAYDPSSIVAKFRGTMKGGRADGRGIYSDRSGLVYDGEWKDGVMEGYGSLRLPNADEYLGRFRDGKANGIGHYIDVRGEIYDGTFVDGLRDGRGVTQLPNGQTYPSTWIAGQESEGSRAVRISQVGAPQVPDGSQKLTIAVELSEPDAGTYESSSTGATLWIRPNANLFDAWKGDDDIWSKYVLSVPLDPQGLPISIMIQSLSARPTQIEGIYLDVQSSAADLQPAIMALNVKTDNCNHMLYGTSFELENFGWSPARNAKFRFAFSSAAGDAVDRPPTLTNIKSIGQIDKTATVDFEHELRAAGVNLAYFASRTNDLLECKSGESKTCIGQMKSSGLFGSLAQYIDDDNESEVGVGVTGTLEYTWIDETGAERERASKIGAVLTLGRLENMGGCAEEAGPETPLPQPLDFALGRSDYRLTVISTPRALPAGRTSNVKVFLRAGKSSLHEFRIVAKMADGSEIKSRPVRLLYYVPSWTKY
jgi:hypothetical protein